MARRGAEKPTRPSERTDGISLAFLCNYIFITSILFFSLPSLPLHAPITKAGAQHRGKGGARLDACNLWVSP